MNEKKGHIKCLLIILVMMYLVGICDAFVPVRISVKFILDANGNRPSAVGTISTDGEVEDQVKLGNEILRKVNSELEIDNLGIVDVLNIDQWFNADIFGLVCSTTNITTCNKYCSITNTTTCDKNSDCPAGETCINPLPNPDCPVGETCIDVIDAIRDAALNNSALYSWETDAVNIYINESGRSGIGAFPPLNNIILLGQTSWPETLIHEIGHNLDLLHTHQLPNDNCPDTITDDSTWTTRDLIAINNFGKIYNNLTQAEKDQVDMVWFNVMSYHNSAGGRVRLSECQMKRQSTQGYSDRNWIYSKIPIYVDSGYSGSPQKGSFENPYPSFQDALDAGNINNKVLVLQKGSYSTTQNQIPLNVNDKVDLVPRFGSSDITRQGQPPPYILPINLEKSKSPEVRDAIKRVKSEDKSARDEVKAGKQAAKLAKTKKEKDGILAGAETKRKQHSNNAMTQLLKAEKYAVGKEKLAIQMELAQRYRHSAKCKLAIKYYELVAANTTQDNLKEIALRYANKCKKRINAYK